MMVGQTLTANTVITTFDGVFNNLNWSSAVLTNTNNAAGNTYIATQHLTGGNADEYRYLSYNASPDGSGLYNTMRIENKYLGTTIAAGTVINSIDASFDLIYFANNLNSFNTMAYGLAIFQDGFTYVTNTGITSDTSTWSSKALTGLTASSFCRNSNSNAIDCTLNPVFTSNSTAMQIGYVIANGLPKGNIYGDQKSGLDNFSVTINTGTPEPASAGLAAIGLVLFALGKRRQSAGSNPPQHL